jgi:hypothetical protein
MLSTERSLMTYIYISIYSYMFALKPIKFICIKIKYFKAAFLHMKTYNEDPNQIYPISRIYNDCDEKSFKLLGVLFDEYLSFDDHVSSLCAKISKSLFCLHRIKILLQMQPLNHYIMP